MILRKENKLQNLVHLHLLNTGVLAQKRVFDKFLQFQQQNKKRELSILWWFANCEFLFSCCCVLRNFYLGPIVISGPSMNQTLQPKVAPYCNLFWGHLKFTRCVKIAVSFSSLEFPLPLRVLALSSSANRSEVNIILEYDESVVVSYMCCFFTFCFDFFLFPRDLYLPSAQFSHMC